MLCVLGHCTPARNSESGFYTGAEADSCHGCNVGYWHLADMEKRECDVRCVGQSGLRSRANYAVPQSCRHSLTAAARRLSI